MGNLNFRAVAETSVYVPKLDKDTEAIPLKIESIPVANKGYFQNTLNPGEIQVLLLNNLEVK